MPTLEPLSAAPPSIPSKDVPKQTGRFWAFAIGVVVGAIAVSAWPSSQPPDFQVVRYDSPACDGETCALATTIQNRGGSGGGTLTLVVTDQGTGNRLDSCSAPIPRTATNQLYEATCTVRSQMIIGLDFRTTVTITKTSQSPLPQRHGSDITRLEPVGLHARLGEGSETPEAIGCPVHGHH